MGSLSDQQVKKLVNKCLTDDQILVRPTGESAALYGITYEQMLLIRKNVRTELGRKNKVSYLRKKATEKKIYRIINSLQNANRKYLGIIRHIYEGANLSALGRKYGIKRQRVHQFKDKLKEIRDEKGYDFLQDFIYNELPKVSKKPPKKQVKAVNKIKPLVKKKRKKNLKRT